MSMLLQQNTINQNTIQLNDKILAAEKCLQVLDNICNKYLDNKINQINIVSPLLFQAGFQRRIDIYRKIFAYKELQSIITSYETLVKELLEKEVMLEFSFSVNGLKHAEEILKEIKRIAFLRDKTEFFLEKTINNYINGFNISRLGKKLISKLKVSSLLIEQLDLNNLEITELESLFRESLQGILISNINSFQEQIRKQVVDLIYNEVPLSEQVIKPNKQAEIA